MNSEEYLEYLIDTAKSNGEHHTLPVQVQELELLRAMLNAEKMSRDAKKKK